MSKAINRTGAHVLDDQGLAGEYFKTLSSGDASKRYFNGEKYQSTLLNRVRLFLTVEDTLKELKQFYPYQELVTKSIDLYQEKKQKYISAGLTTTAISWFLIYQFAKRGLVAPVFNKYGTFFKTHRLFRQYVYALILPTFCLVEYNNSFFLNHTQHLWATHSRRLNEQNLKDPERTYYPKQILGETQVGAWQTPFIHRIDRPKKWANQTLLLTAPDYVEAEYEKAEIPKSESVEQGGQGQSAAEEGETSGSAEEQ